MAFPPGKLFRIPERSLADSSSAERRRHSLEERLQLDASGISGNIANFPKASRFDFLAKNPLGA
jgi:hypothetical protein